MSKIHKDAEKFSKGSALRYKAQQREEPEEDIGFNGGPMSSCLQAAQPKMSGGRIAGSRNDKPFATVSILLTPRD